MENKKGRVVRRVVGANVVVRSGRQRWEKHGVRVKVVGVIVARSRCDANVCARKRDKDRERVANVTAGHTALLQVKRTTRQAMRGASIRGERKATRKQTMNTFPFGFVCHVACCRIGVDQGVKDKNGVINDIRVRNSISVQERRLELFPDTMLL